jgi:serine/threonine protein kinase
MEIVEPKLVSQYLAERRIKSLPGEAIFEGKVRDSEVPVILKTFGKSPLSASQKAKWEATISSISALKTVSSAEIAGQELHETGPLVAFKIPVGEILFEWLAKPEARSLVSIKGRVAMLKTLAEAVSSLHEKFGPLGTIHPANVFVSTKINRLLLIDPGIAYKSGLSISGFSPVVTPFLAPEIITGGAPTVESDVFSLAAIAYWVLADAKPFSGENSNSIVASMLSYKTPNITDHIKAASPRVAAVFSRAFSSNPSLRPHSVGDFFKDLEETLSSCGVLANASASSTDFIKAHPQKSKETGKKQFALSLDRRLSIGIITLIVFMSLVFFRRDSLESTVESVVTIENTLEQNNDLPVDPLSFKEEYLPRLNELGLVSLLVHPLSSEELAMSVVKEAGNRDILLRRELFNAALRSPYYRVKITALKDLEKGGQGATLGENVLALSTDEDPLVRGFAARTLGKVGGQSVLGGLDLWLQKEEDPQVQSVLRNSLEQIRNRGR